MSVFTRENCRTNFSKWNAEFKFRVYKKRQAETFHVVKAAWDQTRCFVGWLTYDEHRDHSFIKARECIIEFLQCGNFFGL
jgi:hypothetical protein